MIVKSHFKQYEIKIVSADFLNKYIGMEDTFFIIDRNVYNIYEKTIFDKIDYQKLLLLDAIETNKNIETMLSVCERMTELKQKRNIHLISIGGGITQDITGVVANLLYRGIRWTFVPTTLLAACDSCIGGKTSLNYKNFKNLLGTFYPPDEILIYLDFFDSLSERDYLSGLGEVLKFNFMYGEKGIERIESDLELLIDKNEEIVKRYVMSSLEFKKNIIEIDEFDKGERIKLNFAHTFGHAIETVTKYEVPHGTAVAMGTIVANEISIQRGYIGKELQEKMEQLLCRIILKQYNLENIEIEEIIHAIKKDKKQIDNSIRAVLFKDMKLVVCNDISKYEIENGFNRLLKVLGEKR